MLTARVKIDLRRDSTGVNTFSFKVGLLSRFFENEEICFDKSHFASTSFG